MGKQNRKNRKMSTVKVEGVPDGWVLIRIGRPRTGEWFIGTGGTVVKSTFNRTSSLPIVERLPEPKPVCTWPGRPGVLTLSKGWIAVNADGRIWFYNKKPDAVVGIGQWNITIAGGGMARSLGHKLFTDLPVFNPDLPWTEHIVEVGLEACEKKPKPVVHGGVLHVAPILSIDAELADGWVAEDANKRLYWFNLKPSTKHSFHGEWLMVGDAGAENGIAQRLTDNEVIFPAAWNWDQRIARIVNQKIVRDE